MIFLYNHNPDSSYPEWIRYVPNKKDAYPINIEEYYSVYNPLCNSLYEEEDFNSFLANRSDTIINGINYFRSVVLSERHVLAFREYNQKHGLLRYMELFIDGIPFELKGYSDSENMADYYFDLIIPSPNNKYVFMCKYHFSYSLSLFSDYMSDVEGLSEEELEAREVTKFKEGLILDIDKGFVCSLSSWDVCGNWSYCNQWIMNDKIIFDPNRIE